jgi:hypothetical protein
VARRRAEWHYQVCGHETIVGQQHTFGMIGAR